MYELWREGCPMLLTTMSRRHHVRRVLSVLDLADTFDVVATRNYVRRGKPNPEIDLLAAKKLGVPPEEFLVIGDSPVGVKAALAAGMVVPRVSGQAPEAQASGARYPRAKGCGLSGQRDRQCSRSLRRQG
jgi:beta-phosphoglucomutase-like phosphatase (HAD superfamily)